MPTSEPHFPTRRALLGPLAVLFVLTHFAPAAGAADERPSIALLPVVVHSADNPVYLRQGLFDMLASRFDADGAFRVIRIDDPSKSTTRVEEALKHGREAGADFVLFGSFTRFGAGASLDVQAAATAPSEQGETMREIFVHSGNIGDVIPDLDDLVGKVGHFAVNGYVSRPPPAAQADGARGTSLAEISARLAELEAQVAALQAAAGK